MTLAPPTPKRLEIAERNMKAGMQTVTAVIISSLPEKLTNRVSAMLYMTRITWPAMEGSARESTARRTGASLNNSVLLFIRFTPLKTNQPLKKRSNRL